MRAARIQRALQVSHRSLLAFVEKKELSRDELMAIIDDLASAKRVRGQTRKQAYDDFTTKDVLGIELYRHYIAADPLGKSLTSEDAASH